MIPDKHLNKEFTIVKKIVFLPFLAVSQFMKGDPERGKKNR